MAFRLPPRTQHQTSLPAKTVPRTRQQRRSKSCAIDKDPGHGLERIFTPHNRTPTHPSDHNRIPAPHHQPFRKRCPPPDNDAHYHAHIPHRPCRHTPTFKVRRQNHRAALASTSWIPTTRASSPAHRAACFGAGRDLRGVMRRWVGGLGWRDWEARIGEWSLMRGCR